MKTLQCISYQKIGEQLYEVIQDNLDDERRTIVVKDIVDRTLQIQESIQKLVQDRVDAVSNDEEKKSEQTAVVLALGIHVELRRRILPEVIPVLIAIAENSVSDGPNNIAQA